MTSTVHLKLVSVSLPYDSNALLESLSVFLYFNAKECCELSIKIDVISNMGCGIYFSDSMVLPYATLDEHHLLQCLQLSRTQVTVNYIRKQEWIKEVLVTNRSYCSGLKVCAHEGSTYSVSTKQKIRASHTGSLCSWTLFLSDCI